MSAPVVGAHSVFSFIQRTAEKIPTGTRWQTIDYSNTPHYHYELFNGSGGIGLFLTEYFRQTGNAAALDLATDCWQWCTWIADHGGGPSRGLLTGKTGLAMVALDLWGLVRENKYIDYGRGNAGVIMTEDPGPVTDLMGGAASNGFFLLRLWETTGQREYLDGAVRCAQWIAKNMVRDDMGCHCLTRPDGEIFGTIPYTGAAHGIAGVAHFFLLLHQASGERDWAKLAREILTTLANHALPDRGGLNWSPCLGKKTLDRCQWSHGAPGIGLVFLKAFEVLEDTAYLEVALKCGTTTVAYGDFRHNITQCIGLSGCGELLIELYRVTKDESWLQQAVAFAEMALTYRAQLPEGDAWPTDAPGLYSADFMYGASGLGHYFLRLWKPGEVSMPLM